MFFYYLNVHVIVCHKIDHCLQNMFVFYLYGIELHRQTTLKITVNIQCCNVGECFETFKRCTRERHTKNAVYVYISCTFNLKGQNIHMQQTVIKKNKMNEIL